MCGIAPVMAVVGGAISAAGSMQQGNAQAAAEETRARMAERQQTISKQRQGVESGRVRENLRRVIGQQRAAAGERGVNVGGSVVDVMDDSAREAAFDLESIRFGAEGEQGNLQYEADAARQRARSAKQAGRIGAFGSLVRGFGSAATYMTNPYQRNTF